MSMTTGYWLLAGFDAAAQRSYNGNEGGAYTARRLGNVEMGTMHDETNRKPTTAPITVPLAPVVAMNAEGRDGVLVALSDLHIGGDPGQEDFFCHAELMALLDDLDREQCSATLLINADFFEFLPGTA